MKKINGAYVPTITVIQRNLNPIFEEEEKYLGLNNPCDINFTLTLPEKCFSNHNNPCLSSLLFREAFIKLSKVDQNSNCWTDTDIINGQSFYASLTLTNCCHEGQLGTKNGTLEITWGNVTTCSYTGKVNCKLNKGSKLKFKSKSNPNIPVWKTLTI